MLRLNKHVPVNMVDNMSNDKPKVSLKILSQKEFEKNIEEVMHSRYPISMFDAVILYCEKNDIEIETASSLLSPKMKTRIEKEAIKERMVLGMPARLPIGGK